MKAPDEVAGLTIWIDATDTATLYQSSGGSAATADNDPVGVALSKGGISRCMEQSSSGARPLLRTAVVNGKSVLRFDGSDDFMQMSGVTGSTVGTPGQISQMFSSTSKTAVVALSIASADADQINVYDNDAVLSDFANGYVGIHVSNVDTSTVNFHGYNWDTGADEVVQAGPKSQFLVVSFKHADSTIYIRVNGGTWQSTASGTSGWISSAIPRIGRNYPTSGARFLGFDLAHFATWNVGVSDSDIEAVELWMADQLGISF